MKHFYTDEGSCNYELFNEDLTIKMLKVFYNDVENQELNKDSIYAELFVLTNGLVYDYALHIEMAGIGGHVDVDEWQKVIPDNPKQAIIKEILFDFVEQGFLFKELLLLILDMYNNMRANYVLSKKAI